MPIILKKLNQRLRHFVTCILRDGSSSYFSRIPPRTKALLSDFAHALARADIALVTDIYASARETQKDDGLALKLGGIYVPTRQDVSGWLAKELAENDVIVFMGAGDIYQWGRGIL